MDKIFIQQLKTVLEWLSANYRTIIFAVVIIWLLLLISKRFSPRWHLARAQFYENVFYGPGSASSTWKIYTKSFGIKFIPFYWKLKLLLSHHDGCPDMILKIDSLGSEFLIVNWEGFDPSLKKNNNIAKYISPNSNSKLTLEIEHGTSKIFISD